jgi:hypothetical protein
MMFSELVSLPSVFQCIPYRNVFVSVQRTFEFKMTIVSVTMRYIHSFTGTKQEHAGEVMNCVSLQSLHIKRGKQKEQNHLYVSYPYSCGNHSVAKAIRAYVRTAAALN